MKLNKQITAPVIASLRKNARQHQSSNLKTQHMVGALTTKNLMSDQNLLSLNAPGDLNTSYDKGKGKRDGQETNDRAFAGLSQGKSKQQAPKLSAYSPAVGSTAKTRGHSRQKTGSLDPKQSWNYQNQAYTQNMAFNVAYNSFGSNKNSFMTIYTNKKQRQEIYEKHLFDKFSGRSHDKKLLLNNFKTVDTSKYNRNRNKPALDCGQQVNGRQKGSG